MKNVIFLPPARNYIKKLKDKRLKKLYQQAVDEIMFRPDLGSTKQGDLSGIYSYDIYYNRTNYELAYTLVEQEGQIILIIMAGKRENFYSHLKRYLKSNPI